MLRRLITIVALLAFAYSTIKVIAFKESVTRLDCTIQIVSMVLCFVLSFMSLEKRLRARKR
jgi:hypothetical protein